VAVTLGMGFSAERTARAASRDEVGFNEVSFKETLGTAGAVGLVLGASTLPFYGQPGSHLMNLGYGAVAGLLVGSGIWVYQKSLDSGPVGAVAPTLPVPTPIIYVPMVSLAW